MFNQCLLGREWVSTAKWGREESHRHNKQFFLCTHFLSLSLIPNSFISVSSPQFLDETQRKLKPFVFSAQKSYQKIYLVWGKLVSLKQVTFVPLSLTLCKNRFFKRSTTFLRCSFWVFDLLLNFALGRFCFSTLSSCCFRFNRN